MPRKLPHIAAIVHAHDRDRFFAALFVPEPARSELLALSALNVELAQVHEHVSEEMIGHIRYAWWGESIEKLYEGIAPKGHPVLEALTPMIASGHLPRGSLTPLVETYRAHFPEMPHNLPAIMDSISLNLIRAAAPQSEAAWKKANAAITRHRKKHPSGWNALLALKLLLLSF